MKKDMNIPEFIGLVATQIREAVAQFRSTGNTPLLYLHGLQLQIAFTAEESQQKEGGVELKPWIFSVQAGKRQSQGREIVHAVTLNLVATAGAEARPPFRGTEMTPEEFNLLLLTITELRVRWQAVVFNGPDTELLPPFLVLWRTFSYTVEIKRKLAKLLIQHIDQLHSFEDVTRFYDGALDDIMYIQMESTELVATTQGRQGVGVGFR